MKKSDFIMALKQMSAERGLGLELTLGKVEAALTAALLRERPVGAGDRNLTVRLNPNTGDISIYPVWTVVSAVSDPGAEIALDEARTLDPEAELGGEVPDREAVYHRSTRISAHTARLALAQGLLEAEREQAVNEYTARLGELLPGVIDSVTRRGICLINLNPDQPRPRQAFGSLYPELQAPGERYRRGQKIRALLLEVRAHPARPPEIVLSRTHPDLLRKLLEAEVPEIAEGAVAIRSLARRAGARSKVAVSARGRDLDPVGACLGYRGRRIKNITNELQGETIDVIEWNERAEIFIPRALAPAGAELVALDETAGVAGVVVPEPQLPLVIDDDRHNGSLAARLVGLRLEIMTPAQWEKLRAARNGHGHSAGGAVAETAPVAPPDDAAGVSGGGPAPADDRTAPPVALPWSA